MTEHYDIETDDNKEIITYGGEPFIAGNGLDPDKVRQSTFISNFGIALADNSPVDYSDIDPSELVQLSAEHLGDMPLDDDTRIKALRNVIIHLNAKQGKETDQDELPSLD